ncbi:hypothetical protein AcV5_007506 [Taiwanofungus camphoratus]|nr:hypothetical protein AcV5_007506 [Antrodia cinnamomea]
MYSRLKQRQVRRRVKELFRYGKSLRRAGDARRALETGHRWADIFAKAKQGDARLQAILQRYSRMLVAKREKEKMEDMLREAMEWQEKLRTRPILTGAYLRPSIFNGPLPQMKPLPLHVRSLIHKRRALRDKRQAEQVVLEQLRDDLYHEQRFEASLAHAAKKQGEKVHRIFNPYYTEWDGPLQQRLDEIIQTYKCDVARLTRPYPPELLAAIKAARREKVANKTRERERERRGEVLRCTLRRRRRGPPAHVLATMTAKEKHMDKVARSVSEVGYVGQVKRALGFRLRRPDAWKVETGSLEDKPRLDRLTEEIRAENARRRERDLGGVDS